MSDHALGITASERPKDPTSLSRRTLLGAGVAAAGAVGLAACSNEGRGNPTGSASTALQLPNSKPLPDVPGLVQSKVAGVPPAYTEIYPYPGTKSVPTPPGKGEKIRGLSIIWGTPVSLDGNKMYAAINKALGLTLDVTNIPAQNFGDKLVTTIAGGDIPEITTNEPTNRGLAARKYLTQGVFHDLREFLGGDKVNKYPNLAVVPEYAWKNSAINGAVYGVPNYRNQIGQGSICYRSDWAEKGGFGDKPKNADELLAWLKALKAGGGKDTYPVATFDGGFVFISCEPYRVPSNWRLNDDGTLTKDIETDEYVQALEFSRKMWDAGIYHPDVLTLQPNAAQSQQYFETGRVATCHGLPDQYYTAFFPQLKLRNPDAEYDVMVPPGHDGGKASIVPDAGYYCMDSIPSSVTDPDKIDEYLQVINFLAAPPGTEEWWLTHYGVEGWNYTMKDGVPVPADPNSKAAQEGYLGQLAAFAYGYYIPLSLPDALSCQKIGEEMAACFTPDPTLGLESQTSYTKGAELTNMILDYRHQIIMKRKDMSDLDELRDRWKKNGGDAMRKELEQAIADTK